MRKILLIFLLMSGCQDPQVQIQDPYPYDLKQRVQWVLDIHHQRGFNTITEKDAWRIVRAIEFNGWNQKRKIPTVLIDVSYANFAEESSFDPYSVDHPTWAPKDRSWGIAQVQGNTALIFCPWLTDFKRLQTHYELCITIGMMHLTDVGSIQAYNAGSQGMKKGLGCDHAKKVMRTLRTLPWVIKTKEGKLEKAYLAFFDSSHCGGKRKRNTGGHRDPLGSGSFLAYSCGRPGADLRQ